jgi:hypothetical protein
MKDHVDKDSSGKIGSSRGGGWRVSLAWQSMKRGDGRQTDLACHDIAEEAKLRTGCGATE